MNEVPPKYKGKSVEDVIKMHQEAEKLIGRLSGEVGQLRKTVQLQRERLIDHHQTAIQVAKTQATLDQVTADELKLVRTELEEVRARGY